MMPLSVHKLKGFSDFKTMDFLAKVIFWPFYVKYTMKDIS